MAELEKLNLLPSLMELSVVGNPVSVVGVTDKVLFFLTSLNVSQLTATHSSQAS